MKSSVSAFEWASYLETGHSEIDEQHRHLIALGGAMLESLITPKHRASTTQLQALIDFATEHFKFEESLMRSAAYPETERHAKYHASLLKEIRIYCHRVQRNIHTNPDGLAKYVWDWIALHIDSEDRELVAWLQSREPMMARENLAA